MKKIYLSLIAGVFAAIVSSCGGQKSNGTELTGAGATFPLPFYTMSFDSYGTTGNNKVSYGGTVSLISQVATHSSQTRK